MESESDRLERIEKLLPILVRLPEHMKVKDVVEELKKDLSKSKEEKSVLEGILKGLGEKIESVMMAHNAFVSKVAEDYRSHEEAKNGILSTIQRLNDTLNGHEWRLGQSKKKLEEMEETQKNLVDASRVNALENSHQEVKSLVQSMQTTFLSTKDKVHRSIETIVTDVKNHQVVHEALRKDLEQAKQAIQSLTNAHAEGVITIAGALANTTKELRSEFMDEIAEIPSPKQPLTLQEVQAEFKKIYEPVSNDAKNSVLRSNNTDMKMGLLEKKVEQLTLLCKRFELMQ